MKAIAQFLTDTFVGAMLLTIIGLVVVSICYADSIRNVDCDKEHCIVYVEDNRTKIVDVDTDTIYVFPIVFIVDTTSQYSFAAHTICEKKDSYNICKAAPWAKSNN